MRSRNSGRAAGKCAQGTHWHLREAKLQRWQFRRVKERTCVDFCAMPLSPLAALEALFSSVMEEVGPQCGERVSEALSYAKETLEEHLESPLSGDFPNE